MTGAPLVVSHTLRLRGAAAESVVTALRNRPGVRALDLTDDGRSMEIVYDLRHLRIDDVEAALAMAGAGPAHGLLQWLRRGWTRFTEENILASVSAPVSPCCSRPPGIQHRPMIRHGDEDGSI
ncbi:MAG: hypothetical protein Q7R40_19385 [Phaeospirillum sp.]|nr:hypothetical protein [Phaeospirillum sp.]